MTVLEYERQANDYFRGLRWKYYFSIKLMTKTITRLERRCETLENSILQATLENELERIEHDEIRGKIRECHERMNEDVIDI